MRIAVTGATGLIGSRLCRTLLERGDELVVFARNTRKAQTVLPGSRVIEWDALTGPPPAGSLDGVEAVVHLLGEGIADGRWTEARKVAIRESRIQGTRHLMQGLEAASPSPEILVSASAVGFYGPRGDEELDESSSAGQGFLARVCEEWEREAQSESASRRTVLLRTGLVLSTQGGALAKMLLPFKMCVGGVLGSGRQYMSWIHIKDEVGLICHSLDNQDLSGPLNATAPNPVTNSTFTRTLAKVLGRPAILPVPALALKLLFGEMAEQLLLKGQRVVPDAALESGYSFRFPHLQGALEDLVG